MERGHDSDEKGILCTFDEGKDDVQCTKRAHYYPDKDLPREPALAQSSGTTSRLVLEDWPEE
jgi:hypothetical protein